MLKSTELVNTLSVHHLIETRAEKSPNHVAIVHEGTTYTYHELNAQANQLAHFLLKTGFQQDRIIALSIYPSPQLIISLVAILKAGFSYLPIDARHPKNRLKYILEDTKTPVIITQSKSKDQFADFTGSFIEIDQVWDEV